MLSKRMLDGLNSQITKELYSSYLYLQMAAWFDAHSLPGMATWMKVQAQEEMAHGMIFYNYVNERGGTVDLGAIDKPEGAFDSALDVFKATLAHEETVTASINNLVSIAEEEKDYATRGRLLWFVDEQVEEEGNAMDLIGVLEMVKDGNGLFQVDRELGARVFTVPAPLAPGA
jgi:ferritin